MTKIEQIQSLLGVRVDNQWGRTSQYVLDGAAGIMPASSFADPQDIAAFNECKKHGNLDSFCFSKGDNGIGFSAMPVKDDNTWIPLENDKDNRINCATDDIPICALPPEVWQSRWGTVSNAAGKYVRVTYKSKTVIGILGDTMPHISNRANTAGIDLNPGFGKAFGVKPPFMLDHVSWEWV